VQGFCQRRKCQSEGGKRLSSGGQSMSLQSWPWWIEQIHSKKRASNDITQGINDFDCEEWQIAAFVCSASNLASEHMCPHHLRVTFHVKKQRQLKRWASMDSRLLWQFWVLRICSSAEGRTELLQLPHFGHLGRPQLDKLTRPNKKKKVWIIRSRDLQQAVWAAHLQGKSRGSIGARFNLPLHRFHPISIAQSLLEWSDALTKHSSLMNPGKTAKILAICFWHDQLV
jgi:hypothetical protein